MTAPNEKRSFSGAGIGAIDLTSGQIRRDAYLFENKEMIVQGITGVVRSYYFAFDSIPEYAEHTRSMTLLNEKIQAYAKEKIQLEEDAAAVREQINALGEEPKLERGGKAAWLPYLLLFLILAYWIYAAVISGRIAFDPSLGPVTGIASVDAVFAKLPAFLLFPQAVYSQAAGIAAGASVLSSPAVMTIMAVLPLLLILLVIALYLISAGRKKRYEEEAKKYREDRAALEEELKGIEEKILQDTRETAEVSDDLNSTQEQFRTKELDQYHRLIGRYTSLLKYRSLIPEEYHNPAALSELVKILTTFACDTWGEALELCDIRMAGGDSIPLTDDLFNQIGQTFHNDKYIMHMMSVSDNDVKLNTLAETWKANQVMNQQYINYEKSLQAMNSRSVE